MLDMAETRGLNESGSHRRGRTNVALLPRAVIRQPLGALAVAVGVGVGGAVAQADDAPKGAGKPAPTVTVAEVVEKAVPVDRVYTGTTAAVKAVELQAQVTGYLLERKFTEGDTVAAGETLYLIDPRPFQAVLDQRQAQLREQEAVLKYAKTTQARYERAAKAGATAREQLDQAIELEAKTEASIGVFKAEIEQAQINLDFTEIKAPFDGRVGRTLANIGALVKANDTALASFVRLNPIYVYFSPPETELLLIEDNQAKAPLGVTMTLPHAATEEFKGTLTFISNKADARTGTITMRATVSNPEQRIRPGQFALVRLHIGEDPNALVVPAKAVSSLQGQRFVMVVGKDNKLENRKVGLGRQVGTEGYVVESGLSKGDRVVVSDTRGLKIGDTVSPQSEPAS
jgi:multidrug efflux system membrane fusion protein